MRLLGRIAPLIAALALAGCPNPNDIGVQNYGTVNVKTVDASNGQPVAGALVSAGSNYVCTTASDGTCSLSLPVGKWSVSAHVAGLHGTSDVTVAQDQQVALTIQMAP